VSPSCIAAAPRRRAGFSLVEVLVALVVIAVGMLGIAKMHALALAGTGAAGTRSLIAIEAAGLATSLHANRDYWATTGQLVTNIWVSPGLVNIDVPALATVQTCTASCTSTQMAGFDLQSFGAALSQIVPAANANISCQNAVPPQSCTITITWLENIAGMSAAASSTVISSAAVSTAPSSNLLQQPQYILYVEP
jgi:type IV pilus assembly protein PilV